MPGRDGVVRTSHMHRVLMDDDRHLAADCLAGSVRWLGSSGGGEPAPTRLMEVLWLGLLLVAGKLLAPVAAPAHPGLMRMAGAGRGPLLGVPSTLRMKYPAVANPCGNFTCHPGNFTCLDRQQVVPAKKINDNECDCHDGSDEPSTSACSTGRFFCANKVHTSKWLNSSSVNDGVCDCCDGTDEHERGGCPNMCAMLANYERHVKRAAQAPVLPAASLSARRAQREANERAQSSMRTELEQLLALQANSEDRYRDWILQHGEESEPASRTGQSTLNQAHEVPNEAPDGAAVDTGAMNNKATEESLHRVVAIKGRPFARGDDLKFKEGDVIVVERKDDMIWWYGYVEGDESAGPRTHGRFASNLVVNLGNDITVSARQRVLKDAQVDAKAQAAEAVSELQQQLPKRQDRDEAIAQARKRAEARANGEEPQIAALPSVKIDDKQLYRTAKVAHDTLRRERTDRALQISRLRRRISTDVPVDWLHLHNHCLTLRAGEQGEFKVCLFEKIEWLPFVPKHDGSGRTGTKARSTAQLIGKWNSTNWKLRSWPGQAQAEVEKAESQSTSGDASTTGVSAPILMQFDGGAGCSAQPRHNFSATVEMRCDSPLRTKTNQAANAAAVAARMTAYDELQSVHQLPHKPCHYIFALASPDACNTHRVGVSGSGTEDATALPPAMPLSPIDRVEAFESAQMASQEMQSQQDPAKIAAQRRVAEDTHRASMEEARKARKQKVLDIQMQRQQEQKQGAEKLLRKTTDHELGQTDSEEAASAPGLETPAASALSNTRNNEEDLPQLSHGVLSGFGSPPATPEEGLPPQADEDREL